LKVVGLESHTFDVGEAKYAAKYQKSVDAIANHIQKDYKGGPEMAQAIRDLELPVIDVPTYPVPTAGAALDPGAEYLWRHDVTEAKKRIIQLAENSIRPHYRAMLRGSRGEDKEIVRLPHGRHGPGCSEAAPDHLWILLQIR
jgi:hypothetical protein